jgi:hypothetical protein
MTEDLDPKREHNYHADATALFGHLHLPLEHLITPQSFATLPEKGGYFAHQPVDYRVESVISYRSAHTQVAGHRELKVGRGWNTLVTSVVEDLNILDVVTADRVVAQVATEHPLTGYVPSITFLGTRFENLRIAGHEVKLDLDLNIFGDKPENDEPYTRSEGFIKRVTDQHARIRERHAKHQNPLTGLLERYNRVPESFENSSGTEEKAECSLVNQAEGDYPGHCFGHVIHVPDFGTIHLATIHVRHCDYKPGTRTPRQTHVHLHMIEANMGCVANGTATVASTRTNGDSRP